MVEWGTHTSMIARMRSTRVVLLVAILFVLGACIAYIAVKAQIQPSNNLKTLQADQQLQQMLRDFLSGVNDPAAHDRFWADDLIYTGASGKVRTKAEIMKSVREEAAKPPDPNAPKASYGAEDVVVHDFGDFAVVNFRLVAKTDDHGKVTTDYYRNTGTFAKRNGQWKVVGWQATKIQPEEKPSTEKQPDSEKK